MNSGRTFHPGAASLVAVAVTSVACNAIFDITEGTSRHSAAGDDDDTQAGVSGASPGAGTNGIPKGGKGGAAAGGAAGLSMGGSSHGGSSNGGAGGATSATGGDGTNGGSAGSSQGTGGSSENGGTGGGPETGGTGGNTSGSGGSMGGTAGSMAGTGGGAGDGPKTFIEAMPIFIWPKCSEDTSVLALTCAYYGDETLSSCPSGGAKQRWTFPIGGTKDTTYRVDVVAFGAVQEHCMTGGTQFIPEATGAVWLQGGQPAATDGPVFELHVKNAKGTDSAMYYLNAFKQPDVAPQYQLPECDTETVLFGSMRFSLDVPGQGTLEAVVTDPDCEMATNCGTATDSVCVPYGTTTFNDFVPAPPFAAVTSTYAPQDDRYVGNAAAFAQFWYLQVKSVTPL